MKKRLSAIGNSLGFIVEKPILELLNVTKDTEFDVRTDGEVLVFRPIRSSGRYSPSAEDSRRAQLRRIKKMSPLERVASAMALGRRRTAFSKLRHPTSESP